jgi:hypothetical protein
MTMLSTEKSSPDRHVAIRAPSHRPTASRRRVRIESEILRARGLDLFRSWAPKTLLLAVVLAVGAAEFTPAARHREGLLLLFGLPPLVVALGLWRLLDSPSSLRSSALFVGALLAAVSELTLALGATLGSWIVLLVLAISAAVIEGVAARRGTSTRFGACAGIAVTFALYAPGRLGPGDLLEAALGALVVATLAGGISGLTAGVVARWRAGASL